MIQLGTRVRDVITGFEGIVYGRIEYLTGCVQLQVIPWVDADGKRKDAEWFDEARCELVHAVPVKLPGETQTPPLSIAAPAGPSCERMPGGSYR